MIKNPFTPSEIASGPEDFFGRSQELRTLERSLVQGSVAIQGPMGIGKSSLLARARLLMEGFNSTNRARSVIAVGDKDIKTIDEAARLLLESFINVDQRQSKVKFKLGSVFEIESSELCKYFAEGRHLAVLKRIVEEDYLRRLLSKYDLLILAVDEADKCPVPLARLIRSIVTHTQQQGVKQVRFIVSGVSPFFQEMVNEDPGINRFIYKTITLPSMSPDDAADLVETKFHQVEKSAEQNQLDLKFEPEMVTRIVELSGGHPHIIQLLGSHIIEEEYEDPDGIIDSYDLLKSIRRICYEDRARVYDSALHTLDLHGMLESFMTLLELMHRGFPSRLNRRLAQKHVSKETIQWLVDHNILTPQTSGSYGLVDEFLRIRLILDQAGTVEDEREFEELIIVGQRKKLDDDYEDDDDEDDS